MSDTVNPLPVNNGEDIPTFTTQNTGATGAYLGLNDAVRLSGVSKPTFLKYVGRGKLSPILNEQGRKLYQVVDIQRVFPSGGKATSQVKREVDPSLLANSEGLTAVDLALLKAENQRLREKLEAEQEKARLLVQIADDAKQNAEDWKQQAERVALMLTHRPELVPTPEPEPPTPAQPQTTPQSQTAPEPKKGFFGRLFGGNKR
jgi:hypothetical protein